MPLRATIAGKEIISSLLSENQWSVLGKEVKENGYDVIISQTKKLGYLRKSMRGLNHFVHKKGEKPEGWKPESHEHLWIKNEIILGCKEAGWKAIPEYQETFWIADVLAEKESKKIAFEVQWSPQTAALTRERQERYKNSDVRACWFFKTPPKEFREPFNEEIKAIKEIPMFRLIKNESKRIVFLFNEKEVEVKEFVKKLLSGQIKYRSKLKAKATQEIEVSLFKDSCWKCGKEQDLYFLPQSILSKCNKDIYLSNSMWDGGNLSKYPELVIKVLKLIDPQTGEKFKIGAAKKRYSKTVGKSYLSFGCFYCDVIFGDFFLPEQIRNVYYNGSYQILNIEISLDNVYDRGEDIYPGDGHWCFTEDKDFC